VPALDVPSALLPFAVAWVALVGAIVGSFLNVVIARVPEGLSVVHPGSRCPRCGAGIRWYDNIPVLSFLLLRARCRGCGAPISWRYPLVEVLGAAAAVIAFERHGPSGAALAELAFADLLLALAFIDLDTWLLPHALTVPLLVGGQVAAAYGLAVAPSPASSAAGLVLGMTAFAVVALVGEKVFKKEALGFGDVWLLGGIGAWLGAPGLLPVVLLASTQGAIVGGVLLALGRGQPGPAAAPPPPPAGDAGAGLPPAGDGDEAWIPPRHAIPFGPFLAAAALEWLYLAEPLARAVPLLRPFV
jgi:leader peptidase (prepilin peptidase) / N-methyltransferase